MPNLKGHRPNRRNNLNLIQVQPQFRNPGQGSSLRRGWCGALSFRLVEPCPSVPVVLLVPLFPLSYFSLFISLFIFRVFSTLVLVACREPHQYTCTHWDPTPERPLIRIFNRPVSDPMELHTINTQLTRVCFGSDSQPSTTAPCLGQRRIAFRTPRYNRLSSTFRIDGAHQLYNLRLRCLQWLRLRYPLTRFPRSRS